MNKIIYSMDITISEEISDSSFRGSGQYHLTIESEDNSYLNLHENVIKILENNVAKVVGKAMAEIDDDMAIKL